MARSKERVLNPDLDAPPPRPPSSGNPALAVAISAFAVLGLGGLVWLNFGGGASAPLVEADVKDFKVRGEGPEAAEPPPPADRAVYDVIENQTVVARPLPAEALAKVASGAAEEAAPAAEPAGPIDLRKPVEPAPTAVAAAEPKQAPPPPAARPAKSGPVVVQVAALRSADAAKDLFLRVQDKVPAAAGAILIVQPVAQPSGQIYRVRIGHFADRAGADTFCASLRAQAFDCQVIAP